MAEVWAVIKGAVTSVWTFLVSSQLLGVLIGFWVAEYWKHRREKSEKAALLETFAVESVNLFERFVQYCRQICPLEGEGKPQISLSIPYEMMPASSIARLVELGADQQVLKAIYQVRKMNSLVTLQSHRANDLFQQEHMEELRFNHQVILAGPTINIGQRYSFEPPLSQKTFNSIFAFFDDENNATLGAVITIVNASLEGKKNQSSPLHGQLGAASDVYRKIQERVRKLQEPRGHEPAPL